MARLKLALIVLLVFLSNGDTWKLPVFEAKANFEQTPTENAFASTGNENLIFDKPKAQNQLLKINFAVGEKVNDGKIAADRDLLAAGNRIKSGKMQFESGKFSDKTGKCGKLQRKSFKFHKYLKGFTFVFC